MPVIERRRQSRINERSAWLRNYRGDVKSQCGEDGILEKIFEVVGEDSRWCVEFGAWDGNHLSNTWNLIYNRNWSGVLIEGDANRFADLARNYLDKRDSVSLVQAFVGWDGDSALDSILQKTQLPRRFDLLSVDVDGNDWHIWNALNSYRPRVVVIEFNPTIPNDVVFIQDADFQINQGCSLLALIELAKKKGYELVAATGWNGIFVERELFPSFGIEDNSIDALYDCELDIELFHGYDGAFYGAGHLFIQMAWNSDRPERLAALAAEFTEISRLAAELIYSADKRPLKRIRPPVMFDGRLPSLKREAFCRLPKHLA